MSKDERLRKLSGEIDAMVIKYQRHIIMTKIEGESNENTAIKQDFIRCLMALNKRKRDLENE